MTTSKAPETGACPQAAAKGSGLSADASHCTATKRSSRAFRAAFWAAARTARASVSVPYARAAPSFSAAIARTPDPATQRRTRSHSSSHSNYLCICLQTGEEASQLCAHAEDVAIFKHMARFFYAAILYTGGDYREAS